MGMVCSTLGGRPGSRLYAGPGAKMVDEDRIRIIRLLAFFTYLLKH